MLIRIMDPADHAVVGELYNPDVVPEAAAQGAQIDLFFSSTGSDDNDVLFNLEPPPDFFSEEMVWCQLDGEDLAMYLSPQQGDTTYAFATLNGITAGVSGTGTLYRSNKLPQEIDWDISP